MRSRLMTAVVAAAVSGMGLVATSAGASPVAQTGATSVCIAHHFGEGGEYRYTPGCTGHDEPELDPVSAAPGSALNITWPAKLPSDGNYPVDSVGPTCWWGGTVAEAWIPREEEGAAA